MVVDFSYSSTKFTPNPFKAFGPLPNNMLIRSRPVGGGHCNLGSLGHGIANPDAPRFDTTIYGPLPLPPAIHHFVPPKPGSTEPALRPNSSKQRPKSVSANPYNYEPDHNDWDRFTKNWKKSKYHTQCTDYPWVPSPANTTKRFKSNQVYKSYPLCLVCDRDYGYFQPDGDWCPTVDDDTADYLFKKFQKNAER